MKTNKFNTLWIISLSCLNTGLTCVKATIKRIQGNINRPWVDKTMNQWVNRTLNLVRVTCKTFNPYQVSFPMNRPTIIMSNHSSLYDIPILLQAFPNASIRMLAKKEMEKIPLMGKGMKAAEFPFIDRKNRHQAIKDLQYVKELLESGIVMWLSPEGTRSKNGKLASFKKGGFITAIQTNALIIPVGIRGAHNILPARTFQLNTNLPAEVHIGRPIDAAEYTLENKDLLIQKTREVIEELVGEEQV